MTRADLEQATLTLTPAGPSPAARAGGAVPRAAGALALFEMALEPRGGAQGGAEGAAALRAPFANPLMAAAADLLAVCGTLQRFGPGADIAAARGELARAIIDLKYRVVRLDYPPSVAENLCLLFAIVIDEFAMHSPWGRESGWENRALVADLFGARDGGERFYQIAERALLQPRALADFLEIVYVFLKLGYRGRYAHGGDHQRDRVIDRIEAALRHGRPGASRASGAGPDALPAAPDLPAAPVMAGLTPPLSRPPHEGLSALRKLGLGVLGVALVWGAVWIGREQMILREGAAFAEMARKAAASGQVEYVYSSETGRTRREASQ